MKRVWTVRVINWIGEKTMPDTLPTIWVEQLRSLGYIRVLAEHDDRQVLEFRPPKSLASGNDQIWARQEAERMTSFGLSAVSAPEWLAGQAIPS